jgi:hypothetical protein
MDLAVWLRKLGRECHEYAFWENEIDWELLPELTEADLEKLGLPLRPRKDLPRLPRSTWVNSLAYPGVLLSDRLANTVHHEPSRLVGHTACGAAGVCSRLSRKAHEWSPATTRAAELRVLEDRSDRNRELLTELM